MDNPLLIQENSEPNETTLETTKKEEEDEVTVELEEEEPSLVCLAERLQIETKKRQMLEQEF